MGTVLVFCFVWFSSMAIRTTEVDRVGRVHVTCIEMADDTATTVLVRLLGSLGKQLGPIWIRGQGMGWGHATMLQAPLLKVTGEWICTGGSRLVGDQYTYRPLGPCCRRATQQEKRTEQRDNPDLAYHEPCHRTRKKINRAVKLYRFYRLSGSVR